MIYIFHYFIKAVQRENKQLHEFLKQIISFKTNKFQYGDVDNDVAANCCDLLYTILLLVIFLLH